MDVAGVTNAVRPNGPRNKQTGGSYLLGNLDEAKSENFFVGMGAPSALFPLCGADVRRRFLAAGDDGSKRSCLVVDVKTVNDERFP